MLLLDAIVKYCVFFIFKHINILQVIKSDHNQNVPSLGSDKSPTPMGEVWFNYYEHTGASTETLIDASKEVGLEVNAKGTK
jgi:hypothetical protein